MTKNPLVRIVGKRRMTAADAADDALLQTAQMDWDEHGNAVLLVPIDPDDDAATAHERNRRQDQFELSVATLTPSEYAAYLALSGALAARSAEIDARISGRSPYLIVVAVLPDIQWRMTFGIAFRAYLNGLAARRLSVGSDVSYFNPERGKWPGAATFDVSQILSDARTRHAFLTCLEGDKLPKALAPLVDVVVDLAEMPVTHLAAAVARAFGGWTGTWPELLEPFLILPETFDSACSRAPTADAVPDLVRMLNAPEPGVQKSEAEKRFEAGSSASTTVKKGSVEILRPTAPLLEELHGYGEFAVWARQLVADVDDYRIGTIGWSDVDGGCMLHGPPGTGKTLAAKALAASCGVAFLPTSFAAWQGVKGGYLGDVVNAMRAVFAAAAENAPCVLFIDEIDSIPARGGSRSHDDYWRPIVNAALECLDGTARREGVIVLAACNDPSSLDPALVRSGRLDRRFEIGLPDEEALLQIIGHHLRGADLHALKPVATALAGSASGADIARIARDARRTARRQKREVTAADMLAIAMPPDLRPEPVRRMVAIHEAGHAVVAMLQGRKLRSTSILQTGGTNGGCHAEIDHPTHIGDIVDLAVFILGGRAAEAVCLGTISLGSGGGDASDLARATDLVRQTLATGGGNALAFGIQIDGASIERQLQRLYAEAVVLVSRHRPIVEALADLLLERRILGSKMLAEFASAHGLGGAR